MIRNHIIIAIRNLIKYKGFSFIHIGGLALGLTAGIYVIHYARLEYGNDLFHKNVDQIYRVATTRVKDGIALTKFASTYSGVGPAMKAEYPEVENYTRLFRRWRGGIISYNDIRFREKGIFHADSGFFNVFSFPILAGTPNDLHAPNVAFVEEATAKKYFGDENPIGKRITFGSVEGLEEYEIRGVLRCPENSSIKFTFILSYQNLGRIFGTGHIAGWVWLDFHTFIQLKKGAAVKTLEDRFPKLLKKFRGDRAASSQLFLQHFPDIYLQSHTEFETGITGDQSTVRILLILGIIIIAIAWLNFLNLYTSHALARAKEVGIRKTLGSSRQNLVVQFLIETALMNLVAIVLCCGLLWLLLPYFSQLTGKPVHFTDFAKGYLWKYLIIFFLFGTMVVGAFPAVQLSSFRPIDVLKGFFSPKGHGAFFRELFVGFQALVSFSLVASILIVVDQVRYVNSKELGITINQTLVVRTPEIVINRREYLSSLTTYKSEVLKDTRILKATTSADCPGEDVNWIGGTRKLGADPNESTSFYRSIIDEDFIKTMGLKIITGQNFGLNQSNHDVLVNRIGVKALELASEESSIGQKLIIGADTCTIVGVVEDFHQVSPREAIAPTVFHFNLETPRFFFIKFNASNSEGVVTLAQNAFAKLFPTQPFDYYFLDEFYDRQYAVERKLTTIISVFCILAVFVSSLGLLGLTWFRLSKQKKELAIRKIVGSTNLQLFYNASRRLFQTTLIGCMMGIPVTWYIMSQWLQGFSLHTHPKAWQFGIALMSAVMVALLTVSGHTLKVIRTNPVNHLKQE